MDNLQDGDLRRYPISPVAVAAVLIRKDDKVLLIRNLVSKHLL